MQILVRFIITLLLLYPLHSVAGLYSAAFYYGNNPPLNKLRAYDAVIVNSDAINPKTYNTKQSELFAYVSVGEVAKSASYYSKIPSTWFVATNKIWQSGVINQANPEWQTFFLNEIIKPAWEKGYRGFFLDTLDSYQLAKLSPAAQKQQIDSLIQLIQAIKNKYPDAKLILNRGFELLPSIHNLVYAVVAESLFSSWDQQNHRYVNVTPENTAYLLKQLKKVQAFNIPVIVIDYLPPEKHAQAVQLAKKISALGMIPWVTDGQLETIGTGNFQPINRKIFVIYTTDSDTPEAKTVFDPPAFVLLGMPLEYFGYLPEFHDGDAALPSDFSPANYAGIIVYALPKTEAAKLKLHDWIVKRLSDHIPILFMGGFGFNPTPELLAPFGLNMIIQKETPKNIKVAYQDSRVIGYEIKPYPNKFDFFPLTAKNSKVSLQLESDTHQLEDVVAITPWGGYALEPFVSLEMPNSLDFWVLNPWVWLPQALRTETFPIPDVTTENGRRLMFAHIDGDGFPSKAEWREGDFAGVEIENQILKKYQIPTTVSVITGDVMPNGLYPQISSRLMEIARDIYKLPWVEAASHTFSHPFNWILVLQHPVSGKYNLPIPHYIFNPRTEIFGSAEAIDKNLLSPGKTCKIVLWSGLANPNENEISLAYQANLANLNGGNTHITHATPSITNISPTGLQIGKYYLVYAPITNEEFYTNYWTSPFYGYERVIETFQMTDTPRRLKPIDIYYHFYSGIKKSSLLALNKVYQWTLSQPVFTIFASDYFAKVLDANNTSISRTYDGGWRIKTAGDVHELRIPQSLGYPDVERSQNVIGYSHYNDSYYVHLGPEAETILYVTKTPSSLPYLVDANGKVTEFKRDKNEISFHLQGYLPLQFSLGNMKDCTLKQKSKLINGTNQGQDIYTYTLTSKDSDELQISCRK